MKLRYFLAGFLFSQCVMPVVYGVRDLAIEYLRLLYPIVEEEEITTEDTPKPVLGFKATEEDKTDSENV